MKRSHEFYDLKKQVLSPHGTSLLSPPRARTSLSRSTISYSVPTNLNKLADQVLPKRPFEIRSVRDLLLADIPLYENDFKLCPHKHHCLQNAIFKGLFRTLAAGYVFKTSLSALSALASGKLFGSGWRRTLRNIYRGDDAIQFAQFLAVMSCSYKLICCGLRRYRYADPTWHHALAGFLSASAVLLDDPSRRNTLALYCIVRALGDYINYKTRPRKDATERELREHERRRSRTIVALFTILQMLIIYGAMHATDKIDRRYYKWIVNMGALDEHGVQVTIRSPSGAMFRKPDEPFQPCHPFWHEDPSCLRNNTIDWFAGLGRAARMYVPVHILPTVLFTPKYVFTHPSKFVEQKFLNILRSSVFLTTYQASLKQSICTLRNLVQDDPGWVSLLSGIPPGLSLCIEHPKRRMELLLYVLPRGLEILLRMTDKTSLLGRILRHRVMSVVVFQCAIAAWMAVMHLEGGREICNTLNISGLKIVFGTKH